MKCLKCLSPVSANVAHYGLHKDCFEAWFKTPITANFVSLVRISNQVSNLIPEAALQNPSFFHGKFKKYSAELNGRSFILKMRENETPELPEVEYLCNQIGKMLGIPVADFYIVRFGKDRVFVTKNFMNLSKLSDLKHIHHFRPDSEHSCEGLIRLITEKTKRPYDTGILIKTILFDALIGNYDRHGRNLAFIFTSGHTTLSPIYDNVSYLALESGAMLKADFNPKGKISTKDRQDPSMTEYIKELTRLGFEEEISNFYSTINLVRIKKLIDQSFCSKLMKNAIFRLVKKRHKELEDELKS